MRVRKTATVCFGVLVLAAGGFWGLEALAQQAGGDAAKTASKKTRRLPNHFPQLGLSAEQEETVRKLQDEYGGKIDELQRALDSLKADRDKAVHAVLTDAQRQLLSELVQAAKQRRQPPAQDKPAVNPNAPAPRRRRGS